ncbi:signal peptidase II [Nanoarchaeota archaeon]
MVKNNFYLISLAVVILDQILKRLAETYLTLNQTLLIFKNFFHLTLVHNQGAAFGIFQGFTGVFVWIGIVILGFILFYWDEIKTNSEKVIIALIAGGIIGNLLDRIILGYTIDFLNFLIWPVFNLADACMTVGVIGLIYLMWKK